MAMGTKRRIRSHEWPEYERLGPPKEWPGFLIGAAIPPLAIVAAMFATAGVSGIEKGLTRFIQPDALLWSLLTGIVVVVWRRRDRVMMAATIGCWLFYTLVGSGWFVGMVYRSLEGPYLAHRPLEIEQPLPRVVVLGGGTNTGANGAAQLSSLGDRVMLAARMLETGKAESIVCTGSLIEGMATEGQLTPADATVAILHDLGISDERIERIDGRTTSEEMRSLAELLEKEEASDKRVGVITSAWHMNRALRLAHAAGLDPVPLPADFITEIEPTTPLDFVPDGEETWRLGCAVKELVAGWVGR